MDSTIRAKLDVIASVCGHPYATSELGALTALYAVTQDGLTDPKDWLVFAGVAEATLRVADPDIGTMIDRIRRLSPVWLAALVTGAIYSGMLRTNADRARAFSEGMLDLFDNAPVFHPSSRGPDRAGAGMDAVDR
ncbi:hypothetical protein SAE02_77570 [Skermanella aerolata]|uniref:Uncharacterized protein n=1 Tax=Skermanella aerolata TaxID=393310 RepID=A0A512E4J0_9PROT|nr:hypothetical protein [Skermanella aerolata]KJB89992.1 hypothetical protein N826_08750 [Skermanella aerolata KACC 11604]GEO43609.1 hypothetical protein SAE02_77570 [Skermanella aerolata]